MPSNKPKTDLRFPTREALESIRRKAEQAGLSLNNYILRELKLELLNHGGAHNKYGRQGKPAKTDAEE